MREQALIALAGAMGMPDLAIASLEGDLDATFELPTLETLAASLAANPALAAARADRAAAEARVLLTRVTRVPDVRVEMLYRRLETGPRDTFDVSLSLPLPLFDRGQGRLDAARADRAAAEARARGTAVELDRRLRGAYAQWTAALERARVFKREILPRAETVLKAAQARYKAGDISLAELLPVRRDFALVQLSHLESLRDVMEAWAEARSAAVLR